MLPNEYWTTLFSDVLRFCKCYLFFAHGNLGYERDILVHSGMDNWRVDWDDPSGGGNLIIRLTPRVTPKTKPWILEKRVRGDQVWRWNMPWVHVQLVRTACRNLQLAVSIPRAACLVVNRKLHNALHASDVIRGRRDLKSTRAIGIFVTIVVALNGICWIHRSIKHHHMSWICVVCCAMSNDQRGLLWWLL